MQYIAGAKYRVLSAIFFAVTWLFRHEIIASDVIIRPDNANNPYKKGLFAGFVLYLTCLINMVPVKGLEPPRPYEQLILSQPCLPFQHTGRYSYYFTSHKL